ncbi:MAG: FHA domain-containing protein [Nannocystaceae bacterium]
MTTTSDLQPYLRLCVGPGAGTSYPLVSGENVIGRDPRAEISIDSPDISRRHAQVRVTGDAVILSDLGSKNGVIIGGKPIQGEAPVGHGARFQLGDLVFEVHHPGSQVQQALARAGETTVTRMPPRADEAPTTMALRWPLLATLVFAVIVIVLVLGTE